LKNLPLKLKISKLAIHVQFYFISFFSRQEVDDDFSSDDERDEGEEGGSEQKQQASSPLRRRVVENSDSEEEEEDNQRIVSKLKQLNQQRDIQEGEKKELEKEVLKSARYKLLECCSLELLLRCANISCL
jgi:hypothetical protein